MIDNLNEALKSPAFLDALTRWFFGEERSRGALAELKRCKSHLDVYISQAYRRGLIPLLESKGIGLGEADLERLALPVGVLAHGKNARADKPFARLLAESGKGSEMTRDVRFRKLLSIPGKNREALFLALVRFVRMVGGDVNVENLVRAGACWNDSTRRNWAEAYYSVHNK
ncbi:type I-E CRISPR-associated protein Cse2/CasB [Pseudodesulfovibrio indicus]|uniref:type I-E CRISPR-associated protein Cse2/CasB n=1 Tax=Pseudodesulfovibrio indicus TaxID=1716143 RepID=UPI00292D6510|nr:type I-E CRISPR-associated protein Cse2/CasB [Pseudodesulfovibrio indicus]